MGLLFLFVGVAFVATFGTLAYQVFLYLKLGHWVEFSATDVCARYAQIDWCAAPFDWVGLHKLLSYFSPGGLALFVSIAVLAVVVIADEASGGQK